MNKHFVMVALLLGMSISLGHPASVPSAGIEERSPGEKTQIYLFLNFDGDPSFPSITRQRNTTGLGRFEGLEFGTLNRNDVIQGIINYVRSEFSVARFPNLHILTSLTELQQSGATWWYTWGIDDTAFVSVQDESGLPPETWPVDINGACPKASQGACLRVYGKGGAGDEKDVLGNRIFFPRHARTFAGSFVLQPGGADFSRPPLTLGTWLTFEPYPYDPLQVTWEHVAHALGWNACHEIGHLFGARHGDGAMMFQDNENWMAAGQQGHFASTSLEKMNITLNEAVIADQFEPNDTPGTAKELPFGSYVSLTLDSPFDNDYFLVTAPEGNQGITVDFQIDTRNYGGDPEKLLTTSWATLEVEYWDGNGTRFKDLPFIHGGGYTYRQLWVPPGRQFLFRFRQMTHRVPTRYKARALPAVGNIVVDNYDASLDTKNDTVATATNWLFRPGAPVPLLTIFNETDTDYYKIDARGYSVIAEIMFDPNRGDLQLSLDGVVATESSLSMDGLRKTLRIIDCGGHPSIVNVSGISGSMNYYYMQITRISPQVGCPSFHDWTPFLGQGALHYRRSPFPLPEVVREVPINKRMFARIINESRESVTWGLRGSVNVGDDRLRFVGNLVIPKPYDGSAVPLVPIIPENPYILIDDAGLYAWYLTTGSAVGTVTPPVSAIMGFKVVIQGLRWNPTQYPNDVATIVIEAKADVDGDLIPDEVETATGTDVFCDDTDGDGLPDGDEDANQNGQVEMEETDPRKWDTDGDGLSDGLEVGLISPHGTCTDMSRFVADADPGLTTDPTNSDTDGDGLSDGEEDANLNGAVDPGENSPINPENNTSVETPVVSNGNVTVTFTQVDRKGNTDIIAPGRPPRGPRASPGPGRSYPGSRAIPTRS